ncbi:MFS transporter [Pseudorhodobacter aquimaris]|uniref:MFS transporter n=1 Tax=Pseudorhodobacter aquimaris TaxID=687412 RepID=UPI000A78347C|nr:MFS transporter [Pseudorhodobacter aquimaris]
MVQNMRETLASVRSLLGGTAVFMAGNSLLGVVLPLRMETAGYPVALTGAIMAAYYLGLALGGFKAKHIIMRIGHIRAFSTFAAPTAATCLTYHFFFTPAAWMILRVVNGFCIAGMTTSIESWLNERSDNQSRGRVLGFYMLAFYLSVALGQTLVNISPVGGSEQFMLASALIGLSLTPIAHRDDAPGRTGSARDQNTWCKRYLCRLTGRGGRRRCCRHPHWLILCAGHRLCPPDWP